MCESKLMLTYPDIPQRIGRLMRSAQYIEASAPGVSIREKTGPRATGAGARFAA